MKNRKIMVRVILLELGLLGLSPLSHAVVPPPDGGYPGQNTAEGQSALLHLAGGTYNTALGWASLGFNVSGNYNTGVGAGTLLYNTADENTATGVAALLSNVTGSENTATGAFALFGNTTGFFNVANGHSALYSNMSGSFNTANGNSTLYSNMDGNGNTANGNSTLYSNTTGDNNTANGLRALLHNTTGSINTANGVNALQSNTIGGANTAIGYQALFNNTAGNFNTALGYFAGSNVTGDNNIDIGNNGLAADSETIRIGVQGLHGATYIAGIRGATVGNGATVVAGTDGHLGTMTSSRRFKEQIKPMDKASEALFAFKPVSFRYKKEIDPEGVPQFGLVAEEVADVNPDLVMRDDSGEIYTVRYEAVNAMLLNEFLKEHRTVQELTFTAAKQEEAIARQQKQIEALTVSLRKVSAQIERRKVASNLVRNNP
jgi:Chaperone of endosialidase